MSTLRDRRSDERPASLRDRKKDRSRRRIQAEALGLFSAKGFQATTIEEIAAAADVAPRTFFRYFSTKDEVVFWPEYLAILPELVSARPADEPAVEALCGGIVEGLTTFYDRDRARVLERLKLAFRTPALQPRLRQQQARSADGMAAILTDRLGTRLDNLEIRAIAAAIAAALWVAADQWQAQDGREELGVLIERTLGTVLVGALKSTEGRERISPQNR
jgi:AcrR family transcriptional regulator